MQAKISAQNHRRTVIEADEVDCKVNDHDAVATRLLHDFTTPHTHTVIERKPDIHLSALVELWWARQMRWAGRAFLSACVLLSGCAAGPDFHTPAAPATERYTLTPMPRETVAAPGPAGAAQSFNVAQEIPAMWWTLFRSPELDGLLREAVTASPTIAQAQAALRQAQENFTAQTGALLYPSVDGKLSATRQRSSAAAIGVPDAQPNLFSLYNASVAVSYSINLSGGIARELEALRSQIEYQNFQLEATYLALSANIVTTAIKEASLRAQIEATAAILEAQRRQLEIVSRQFALGAVSRADVLAQQTQLAQLTATLPPLEKSLFQTRHQLAVYAGKLTSEGGLPEFRLRGPNALQLPRELPLSLPSALLRQRPDVRAAEAFLHQASAQIGVAAAQVYPQLNLTANLGSQALTMTDLFSGRAGIFSLGAGLLQPIFRGGQLSAQRRAAVAAYDAAAAQYRETVLRAFQDVADTLRALEQDALALKTQTDAATTAHDSLTLTQKQFQLGAVSYLVFLNAQRQDQQSRIAQIQAEASRYADTAALFAALGGGWWNRPEKSD